MSDHGSLGLPDDAQRTWLLTELTELLRRADGEHFVCAPVVLPSPTYFPDRWTRSVAGVQRLLRRLFGYADIEGLTPSVQLYTNEAPEPHGVGQVVHHKGAAGLFLGIEADIAYFGADANLLGDPGGITATLAHEVAHAYRTHHGLCVEDHDLEERLTDLTCVFLGFGVLSANASLRHRSGLSENGLLSLQWSVSRLGYLAPQELCFLLAVQAHVRGPERAPVKPLVDHLETNQASFFKESLRWLQRHKPDLPAALGLPPRHTWPPLDSVRALSQAFDETHDEMEVDAVVAAEAPPVVTNVGHPVFRVWKRPRADRLQNGLMLGLAGGLTMMFMLSSPFAMLTIAVLTVVAIRLAGRYWTPRCSDPNCGERLNQMSAKCPRCGGTIAGDLQSADERLDAEEALAATKRALPGLDGRPAKLRSSPRVTWNVRTTSPSGSLSSSSPSRSPADPPAPREP